MRRMILVLIGIIFSLLMIVALVWCMTGTGKIREYKDESGQVLPGSLSEKIHLEINGADNGFFINSKDTSNPVLLLISSGPGTDDYFLTERFDGMHIDDMFTVVYWDYRGMGIAYDKNMDPESITMDVLLEDTKAVTDYLKTRFHQDKIFLMGFSGGTQVGIRAAQKYPEDYYAYIGMAQVVTDLPERDTLMYEFMKKVFDERGDKASLKKLDRIVDHLDNHQVRCHDWYSYVYLLHKAGGGTTYNESEFWGIDMPIIWSHCYTTAEKINYIRGMKLYRRTALDRELDHFDYRESMTEFDIPIYMMSGEYDYNCPWPLVEDYCSRIAASECKFYKVSGAAHSPLWEKEEESYMVMKEIREKAFHEPQMTSEMGE